MNFAAMFFEGTMLLCFGISWPAAIYKTFRTKNVEGISVIFLWFVFAGYLSGIMFKIFEISPDKGVSPVIFLYILNLTMVGTEVALYYLYKSKVSAVSVANR